MNSKTSTKKKRAVAAAKGPDHQGVEASVSTLDDDGKWSKGERTVKPHAIELSFDEIDVSTSIECGFYVDHITARNGETEIKLNSGAGCGSRWISGSIKDEKTGATRYFRLDASKMLTAIIGKMLGQEIAVA